MYCSTCGAESNQPLQYCKRCGSNIGTGGSPAASRPRGLVWIVAFAIAMIMGVPMGGIAVVFDRIPELLEKGFPLWFLMTLALASLVMVTGAMAQLGRLLSPLLRAYLQSSPGDERKKAELSGRAPAQIVAHPAAVGSVTEDTTRIFDPLPSKPK